MAAGEAIGCFGLTEPDLGSDPAGMRTYASRDGDDWVLSRHARCGSPTARSPTSPSSGRRPTRASAASSCPPARPGSPPPTITRKLSLRASRHQRAGPRRRAAARRRGAARRHRPARARSSCLNEARYGIVWGAMGAARDCLRGRPRLRQDPRAVRPADRAASSSPRPSSPTWRSNWTRASCSPCHLGRLKDAGQAPAGAGQLRQAEQRAGGDRDLPQRRARSSAPTASRRLPGDAARHQPRVGAHLRGHRGDAPTRSG